MNQYVTGSMIKSLREKRGLTQARLAEKIFVSDKTVSKWETGRGYPDVSLLEHLASELGVSLAELFSGEQTINANRAANMLKSKFHVCPICANVIASTGEAQISCCGMALPALEAEEGDQSHQLKIQRVEDEFYVTLSHEMTKDHYLSFIAAVRSDGLEVKKLYPEQAAEGRFKMAGIKFFYCYCNHHGLFKARAVL